MDPIERQDAIDALMAWEEYSVWDEECLKHRGEPYWVAPSDVIKQLPSAQPEIIHCPDCKYGTHSGCGDRYICTVNYELRMEHDSSFYCGYGKRREDD